MSREYEIKKGLVYSSPEGKRLRLTLYLPEGAAEAARPAVLLIHGGAWTWGWRQMEGYYGRQFARAGYVAASIDYRRLPKWPFPACVLDARAAVQWLRSNAERYGIDADRIGVVGHSAGGYLAMMLGTTADEPYFRRLAPAGADASVKAVVSIYGPMDIGYYANVADPTLIERVGKRIIRKLTQEVAKDASDPLEFASPITHIDGRSKPTLFIHGTDDSMVPLEMSRAAYEKLRSAGVEAEILVVPGAGHSFDYVRLWKRPSVFARMLEFLSRHL